jgi:pimeloyl-ACP methyl ester carboxylesterase
MVAGHDWGGRVVDRMMLDHPDVITKGAVLDIAPTLTVYDDTSKEFATKYVWWFVQIQPAPMPEHMISLDPGYYLRDHLAVQGKTPGAVTPDAMAEYIRCYCCKGTIRAVCETIVQPRESTLTRTARMTKVAVTSRLLCSRSGERRERSESSGTCWPHGAQRRRQPLRGTPCRAAI